MNNCKLCNHYLWPTQKRITVSEEYGICHAVCAATWCVGYLNCATDLLKKANEEFAANIKMAEAIIQKETGTVH